MTKRRPSLDPRQIGFTFEAPIVPQQAADLAGLGRQVAAAVGLVLKDDARSREEIAGAMSAMLDEEVSRWMLDGYASEARDRVNISFERFLALVVVTKRFDVLDALTRKIGAALLVGEEIQLARAGDLRSRIATMKRELQRVEKSMRPIGRGR